jgi:cytochrome b involved in lipid metabolism
MKTENAIGIIGLVAVMGLVAFFYAQYDSKILTPPGTVGGNINTATLVINTATSTGITLAEVVAHNTATDCWIIVQAKVYNVTNFLIQHPGGASRITPYCGADATTAFATKDGTGTHSAIAESELTKLYVGDVQASTSGILLNSNTSTNTAVQTNTASSQVNTSTPATTSVSLDVATVAKHNRSTDCWIIVNKGVYAVTGYLAKHPGGANRIIPYCGMDATTAFATQGGTGSHSSSASADLAALRLGTLGTSTTTKTITQVNVNVGTLTPQGGEQEEEDDD